MVIALNHWHHGCYCRKVIIQQNLYRNSNLQNMRYLFTFSSDLWYCATEDKIPAASHAIKGAFSNARGKYVVQLVNVNATKWKSTLFKYRNGNFRNLKNKYVNLNASTSQGCNCNRLVHKATNSKQNTNKKDQIIWHLPSSSMPVHDR